MDLERPSNRITDRAAAVEYSAIRKMFERASRLDEEDLIHLEMGEPDFDTPTHITEAASTAAREGGTHYTSTAGMPELREAIATRPGGTGAFDPASEIVVTTGAMEALYLSLQAIAETGDEVVIPTPGWPNYETQARLAGAKPVSVPLAPDDGFSLDTSRVRDAISDDTAAVIISSPSNPTGQVYSRAAVSRLIETAAAHDCYVIADEVYDGFVYGSHPTGIPTYTDHQEYVLSVNSCSKRYAMTGWRIGWLAGPADIIEAATKLHSYTTACASSVSQHAAIEALTGTEEHAREMASTFRNRRDYVADRIAEIPILSAPTPNGAIYQFVDVSSLDGTSVEIAVRLLEEYGVVTAPGSGFGGGGEGYLRLSFANSQEQIERGYDRIERMVRTELGDEM
jgi:aspartate aminotransferase